MTMGHMDSRSAMTADEALAWIAELFEEAAGNLQPATARADVPAWDSLGQLVLMSALDQRFGIRLTQDELASLRSIRDILDILSNHGRLADD
jgi:acyl carrier protein